MTWNIHVVILAGKLKVMQWTECEIERENHPLIDLDN